MAVGGVTLTLLGSCSTSCKTFLIAPRSNPARRGSCEEGGSFEGVLGREGVGVAFPEPGSVTVSDIGEPCTPVEVLIRGGRSSSSPASDTLLGEPFAPALLAFLFAAKVVVEGGRETLFCGVVLDFFLENHPDLF